MKKLFLIALIFLSCAVVHAGQVGKGVQVRSISAGSGLSVSPSNGVGNLTLSAAAGALAGDSTSYIQNTGTLQSGTTMFVGSATISNLNSPTVKIGTITVGGGTQLFVSSGVTNGFGGYSICASTGPTPIPANSSLVIGIPGFNSIQSPMVTEFRTAGLVATDSIGISVIGSNTFTIYNSDLTNAKQVIWWAFCKQ